jgi:hypothetical protein
MRMIPSKTALFMDGPLLDIPGVSGADVEVAMSVDPMHTAPCGINQARHSASFIT